MSPETLTKPCFEVSERLLNVEEINREFARLNPLERIERSYELFGDCLVLPTTFGPTAPLMLTLAKEAIPDIQVVTIRHGYETEETLESAKLYSDELDFTPTIYQAPRLPNPLEGTPEFDEFQRKLKVEPFQQMLDDLQPKAYFSGVMRWQTPEREQMPFIQSKGSVIAINPVLDITEKQVNEFFEQTGLPKNTNYFDPTKGIDQKSECQLNTARYR